MPFVEFPLPRFSYGFEANLAIFPAVFFVLLYIIKVIINNVITSEVSNLFIWCLIVMIYNTIVGFFGEFYGDTFFVEIVKTSLLFMVNVGFFFFIGICALEISSFQFSSIRILLFVRVSFFILVIVCFFQVLFSFDVASIFRDVYSLYYRYFEGRWGGKDEFGIPYVSQTLRLNGTTQEASTLAILVSLFYLPFFLSEYISKHNLRSVFCLIFCVLILLFSMSSTSILILFGIMLIVFIDKPRRGGMIIASVLFFIFGVLWFVPDNLIDLLIEFNPLTKISASENMSTNTRVAFVYSALLSVLSNPINFIFGFGYGNFGLDLLKNIPDWALGNPEVYDYLVRRDMRIHSFVMSRLYDFGFFGFLLFIFYPVRSYFINLMAVHKKCSLNHSDDAAFYYNAAKYFIVSFLFLSFSGLDDRAFYIWFFVFFHYGKLRSLLLDVRH